MNEYEGKDPKEWKKRRQKENKERQKHSIEIMEAVGVRRKLREMRT